MSPLPYPNNHLTAGFFIRKWHENMPKLPPEEQAARYADDMCMCQSVTQKSEYIPAYIYRCSLPKNHAGEHIHHDPYGNITMCWPNENTNQTDPCDRPAPGQAT